MIWYCMQQNSQWWYNAVQYNLIFSWYSAQQWLKQNINQSLSSQQTPLYHTYKWTILSLLMRIWDKTDFVITAPHCIDKGRMQMWSHKIHAHSSPSLLVTQVTLEVTHRVTPSVTCVTNMELCVTFSVSCVTNMELWVTYSVTCVSNITLWVTASVSCATNMELWVASSFTCVKTWSYGLLTASPTWN